jgi:hypothetical protein
MSIHIESFRENAKQRKTPSPKLQTPEKLQSHNPNSVKTASVLDIEAWDFFGAWGLMIGFSC